MRSAGITVDDGPLVLGVARDLKIQRLASNSNPQFLRILKRDKGERDFANLQFLETRLGGRISAPTQVVASEDMVCGVFPYLAHSKVSYERFAASGLLGEVATSLALMHEAGREFARGSWPQRLDVRLGQAFVPDEERDAMHAWLSAARERLESTFAPAAQHCDFTYANLATNAQGQLVIFDWEEFGAIRFPGFDLSTFVLGHYHFGGTIGQALDSPETLVAMIHRDFGESLLDRLGMSAEQYQEAFPLHLQNFLALKQGGFSIAINRRLHAMWMRLWRAEAWSGILRSHR